MNYFNKNMFALLIGSTLLFQSAWAGESVKWVGVIGDEDGYHSSKHQNDHTLEFVRQNDRESFDVVDSAELVKVHTDTDKRLLVSVEGELTNRFLFWGGNLIVKNFTIIKELEDISHQEPQNYTSSERSRSFGRKL